MQGNSTCRSHQVSKVTAGDWTVPCANVTAELSCRSVLTEVPGSSQEFLLFLGVIFQMECKAQVLMGHSS